MDKAKVEKWLNKVAKVVTQFTSIKDFDDTIQLCSQCRRGVPEVPYVQLYSGIGKIAETLDLELSVEMDEDSVTRSFMWNGVMFLQYDIKGEML